MKGLNVYVDIQRLKKLGFKKQQVADRLGCCWRTVSKYWDMTQEEYDLDSGMVRKRCKLERYDGVILGWLRKYPDMTSAQVYDWLLERFGEHEITASERTVRRHVTELRRDYSIPKQSDPRDYEAVPDLPPGKQMQVDFGESWMADARGVRVHVRFAGFVLSYSRYKYVDFLSRPWTSIDLVMAMRRCFDFYGGRPEEVVFDQDSVVSVSENAGDIILTREMELFRAECGFDVFLCHGSDPETKGKVESVVKFVKRNFVRHRTFPGGDDELNAAARAWRARTGNAKPNGTTKEAPASRFAAEQALLIPCATTAPTPEGDTRGVRKDNTILYLQNRYTVPYGTFNKMAVVAIEPKDGILTIKSLAGDVLCTHAIADGVTGRLIGRDSHRSSRSAAVRRMSDDAVALLGDGSADFVARMVEDHPRYERDQLALLLHSFGKFGKEATRLAMIQCAAIGSYSANDVAAWAEEYMPVAPPPSPLPGEYSVTVAKRAVSDYAEVL